MVQFRITTSAGQQYEVTALNFADAIYKAGRLSHDREETPGHVISLWYFHPEIQQWISGDSLIGK